MRTKKTAFSWIILCLLFAGSSDIIAQQPINRPVFINIQNNITLTPFLSDIQISEDTQIDSLCYIIPGHLSPVIATLGIGTAQANAILLDKEYGLFAVNAHFILEGLFYQLIGLILIKNDLKKRWYPLETRPEWINHIADVAIVRINTDCVPELPDPVILSDITPTDTLTLASTTGYLFKKNEASGKLATHLCWLKNLHIVDINYESGRWSPIRAKTAWYQHYILAKSRNENSFIPGLSGSPLKTNDNRVLGILSATNNDQTKGLFTPSFEINLLLEKARNDLKSENLFE